MAKHHLSYSLHIHEEGSKDTPSTVNMANVRYCIYSTRFTHLHKGRNTTFYTKIRNLSFVIALTKLYAIWFWRDMWWRRLRATEKCFPRSWLAENNGRYQHCLSSPGLPYLFFMRFWSHEKIKLWCHYFVDSTCSRSSSRSILRQDHQKVYFDVKNMKIWFLTNKLINRKIAFRSVVRLFNVILTENPFILC